MITYYIHITQTLGVLPPWCFVVRAKKHPGACCSIILCILCIHCIHEIWIVLLKRDQSSVGIIYVLDLLYQNKINYQAFSLAQALVYKYLWESQNKLYFLYKFVVISFHLSGCPLTFAFPEPSRSTLKSSSKLNLFTFEAHKQKWDFAPFSPTSWAPIGVTIVRVCVCECARNSSAYPHAFHSAKTPLPGQPLGPPLAGIQKKFPLTRNLRHSRAAPYGAQTHMHRATDTSASVCKCRSEPLRSRSIGGIV